jgi:type VI secretion system protein ImpC
MPGSSRDDVGFEISAEGRADFRLADDEEPFRAVLIGDFGGKACREPLAARKAILIDRDTFEAVIQRLDVSLDLPVGRVRITDLDSFHPDHLYRTLPVFEALRSTRERLADPETFPEAAREILGEMPAPVPQPSSGASLLDQILGTTGAAAKPARKPDELQAIIQAAIQPYLVARQDPRAPELIRQVDEAAGRIMNATLHHPAFQALEAAWRTVFELVRRIETGPDLKLYLIDVTKDGIAGDPQSLLDLLAQRTEPWSVLAMGFPVGGKDIPLMTVLGKIASRVGAPVLAEADLSLLDDAQAWTAFRHSAEARWVGLALPRVLLRLPYGKATSPCETFDYEEVRGKPGPNEMLYGNPAPFCAMLLAQSFEQHGWRFSPGVVREIGGLPIYSYRDEDGDSVALPCAELALTEENAEALVDNGFMPVAAFRERDFVRVLRFQSAAHPAARLPGRWE